VARKRAEDSYVETQILTASQEELVVKLYDGLIQFTRLALEKMESDPSDIEYIHNQLRKSQRACAILMSSLNFELGGDIAKSLFHVYERWHHELVLANMRQERSRLESLLVDFKEFRIAWSEVIEKNNASLGKVKLQPEVEVAS
jgi:flagellar protein FliS